MIHIFLSVLAGLAAGAAWVYTSVTLLSRHRRRKAPAPEPPVSPSQLAILKEIGRAPVPVTRPRWFKNRPGWFGPTPNERLVSAMAIGYANTIKAATGDPLQLTSQEKIRLARQAFAQDAITIDELERIIENAIKDQA